MKKMFVLLLLALTTTCVAQTFDLGDGKKAVITSNHYTLTLNWKSRNGGTATGTWGGPLKEGKRNGVWKLSITYKNYAGGSGSKAVTGTESMTRTYNNGLPHGTYTYHSQSAYRTCSWDYRNKRWLYGQPESETESVTGAFKNGKAHGKWQVKSTRFRYDGTFCFDEGWAADKWRVQKDGAYWELDFHNHYLTRAIVKNPSNPTWGHGHQWTEEDLTTLPDQVKADASNNFHYLPYFVSGLEREGWIRSYPENASTEDEMTYYMQADFNNHEFLWGNVPDSERDKFEALQKERKGNIAAMQYMEKARWCQKVLSDSVSSIVKQTYEMTDSIAFWDMQFRDEKNNRHPNHYENKARDACNTIARLDFLSRHPELADIIRSITEHAPYLSNSSGVREEFSRILGELNNEKAIRADFAEKTGAIYDIARQVAKDGGFDVEISNDSIFKYFRPSNQQEWGGYLRRQFEKKLRTSPLPYELYKSYLVMKYVDYNEGGGFSIGKMKDTDVITQDDVLDCLEPLFQFIRLKKDIIINYRDSYNRLKSFVLKDILQEVESKKKFQKLLEHIPPFVQQ